MPIGETVRGPVDTGPTTRTAVLIDFGGVLATAGANVVLTSRKQEDAAEVAAQIDEDQARRCVDLALNKFGSVDILVNNAGTNPAYGPMVEQDHEPRVAASTALNRIGEPDDVAAAIVFLASEAAAWITGETMVIDGGQRLGDARPYQFGAMLNA